MFGIQRRIVLTRGASFGARSIKTGAMALRDLPYLPLYVQDFLCDEKLANCSAAATGVYIRLMCILHKSEKYGVFALTDRDIAKANKKAKRKQTENQNESKLFYFAFKLQKLMPYPADEISESLAELEEEGVITITDTEITQKRMAKDGELSAKRSVAGRSGGRPSKEENQNQKQNESKEESKSESEIKTNAEYENEYEYNNKESIERGAGERKEGRRENNPKKVFTPPTYEEVAEYCRERENGVDAQLFVDHYAANGWVQGKAGKPLRDWRAAVRTWERNGVGNQNRASNGTAETRQQAEAAANHRRVDEGESKQKPRRSTL